MAVTKLMFPNLTDAAGYQRVLLTLRNTLMQEPLMVRTRYGQKVPNRRRHELEVKATATLREGITRFGRRAFLPRHAFCSKCEKELRNRFTSKPSGPLYEDCEDFNAEMHCNRGQCT